MPPTKPLPTASDSLPDQSVTTDKLADQAVTPAKISSVDGSNAAAFVSSEQTGDASPHNVAHGLGRDPSIVLLIPSKVATAGDTFVINSHDATNVNITIANGSKAFIFAW